MRATVCLLVLLMSFALEAQNCINGIVRNESNGRPLPFATVVAGARKIIADADGRFSIETEAPALTVKYAGYSEARVTMIPGHTYYDVRLRRYSTPDDGRGNNIVSKAIAAKHQNNPLRVLKSFRVEAYNRLLVTADPDSIEGKIDTIRRYRLFGKKTKIDSSQYKIKKLLQRQHFFASEKNSVYEYDGQRLKETVFGTRMSGFREPLYEVLGLNFQSFSVYEKYYDLLESSYLSPLSDRALRNYNYRLLDSITIDDRQVYLVYFRSTKSRKSARPEGVLYIDAENYAVAGSVVRVRGIIHVTGEQYSEWNQEGFWFPEKRIFTIRKGNSTENITILGETISFEPEDTEGRRAKKASDFAELISVTDFRNPEFNKPVDIYRTAVDIEVKKNAISRSDSFWKDVRPEQPDAREINTYIANDSIAAREKIETKLRLGRKIINGYIPFGPVDLDLRHLFSYNNYEGFRFGLGGITNDRFSDYYRIEGYGAYGTKDGKFKFQIGNAVRIGQFSNTWIGASYTNDVREIASTTFATDRRVFKLYDPRPINVSTFYRYEQERAFIETRIIPRTESIWQLTRNYIEPQFNYAFFDGTRYYDRFTLVMASVALQWNPFSDFMQTPAGRFETEKRYPKFALQITKSFENLLSGNFDFTKIDARAEYEVGYLDGQRSSAMIQGGLATGEVPITHLYSTSPNNLNRDAVLQRITFAGKNSFETMYFNEFFSSRFVSLQLKHRFRPIHLMRKVKPSPVLVTRMVWGTMDDAENHFGIGYKTLEDGFFESGVELNRIFHGFGISGFYRYGPYQLPRFEDNLSLKVSFILNIGI